MKEVSLMMSWVFLLTLCILTGFAASYLELKGLNLQNTLILPSCFFSIIIFEYNSAYQNQGKESSENK